MKFLITLASIALIAGLVIAGPDAFTVELVSYPGHTNFLTTTKNLNGSLDSIRFDVSTAATGTINIAIGTEVVYTNTVAADGIVRPRVGITDNTGAALGNSTNKIYVPYVFCNEPAVISYSGTNVAYQTNAITIKLTDAQ